MDLDEHIGRHEALFNNMVLLAHGTIVIALKTNLDVQIELEERGAKYDIEATAKLRAETGDNWLKRHVMVFRR